MHGVDELEAVASRVVERAQRAGANVAEATARRGSHLSTKVRLGEAELVEEAGSRSLGLRVMIGQQVAVSYTSDLSDAGCDRLIEDAIELARLAEPDSFAGPPDPSLLSTAAQHADLDTFDPSVDAIDAATALRYALEGERAAREADARITNSEGATFSRATGSSVLVTSGGFVGRSHGSYVTLVVSPVADDADGKKRSGYHWTAKRHLADLDDARAVGVEAARRTTEKLGARKLATQQMPVVFDPDAARSIVGLLAGCVLGGAIWQRSSYLLDRIGTQVASELVTIVDDPLIVRGPGSRAFDGEGLLSRRTELVQRGQLSTYLLDSYSGRKLDRPSTASASRGSSGGVGPSTTNLVLVPGTQSQKALLAETDRAFYVTSMMGFGFNAVTGDFSRGASGFLIEKGERVHPVSEVTISLNLDELLKRIDGIADDLDLRSATASPTFRVSSMTVAGS